MRVKNQSIRRRCDWKENGVSFKEVIRQEQGRNNCIFSAGFVKGRNKQRADISYVRLEKNGVEPTTPLLRPDEAQALAWVASGVVWSHLMEDWNTGNGGSALPIIFLSLPGICGNFQLPFAALLWSGRGYLSVVECRSRQALGVFVDSGLRGLLARFNRRRSFSFHPLNLLLVVNGYSPHAFICSSAPI